MSDRRRLVHGVAAGIGAFLVDLWPVLLVWWAGASGSVGDLSEVRFLWVGLVYAVILALIVGRLMVRSLAYAGASPNLGYLDPWGAYAVGIGVYNLALTAVPGIMYALLLTDENKSLRDRAWLVYLLWIGGHLAAALLGFLAARATLGGDRRSGPAGARLGGQ